MINDEQRWHWGGRWRGWTLSLLLAALMMGCTSSPGEANGEHSTQNQGEEREDERQRCDDDRDCENYYRCIDDRCHVPPAMSGEVREETPMAYFEADGELIAEFYLELAIEDYEQQRGLMYREEMLDDWGMLFVYDNEEFLSFWMKNTLISLDMIFVSAEGVVVGIVHEAEPETTSPRTVGAPAQYVLEINGGLARDLGIEAGVEMGLDHVEEVD